MVAIFIGLIGSVDPNAAKSTAGGGRDIPAVGRLERHFVGRAIEMRDDHVIDAPVGLEHANLIGCEDCIDQLRYALGSRADPLKLASPLRVRTEPSGLIPGDLV